MFLSGHGYVDPRQKFWFLTQEADTDLLPATAVSADDLLGSISAIPGKKILFIDACRAGAAIPGIKAAPSESAPDMNLLVNDFSDAGTGIVVYAASMGIEKAREDSNWDKHGAFAKALIEGIGEGKAAIKNRITTKTLDIYLQDRVNALTDGLQHPRMARSDLIKDFPLAVPSIAIP